MIGMSQIKKKTIQGIAIGASVGIIGMAITIGWSLITIKSYENGTNKRYLQNYTKPVAVLTRDVIQGEVITEDILEEQPVHINTVPEGALDKDSVIGKTAKFNISAKVPITVSMVDTEILSSDVRIQEINTVLMPSDLIEGDTIDIRLMYPDGTDYIVIAQKQVNKIYDTTFWIYLSEDERLLLNSAIVDSYLNTGSKLYATVYADSDAQVKNSTDVESEVKGYISEQIQSELKSLKTATNDEAVDTIMDLIIKYRNFANAATRTMENYQPNAPVMNMMKADKFLITNASETLAKLNAESRATVETTLKNYKNQNSSNFEGIVNGAQKSITAQQVERENMISDSKK
ncbi:MAG: flagella basal body P-ring formation protein FlgA [Clostridia bacterium]|nr:flagella basal body P-ring formation protein FlgA [Clostridia bacterium]